MSGNYNVTVQPAPVDVVNPAPMQSNRPAPMQFKVQDSVYNQKNNNAFTVEAEFQKYVSDSILSMDTNILRFWEVGWFLWLNRILAHQLTPSTG